MPEPSTTDLLHQTLLGDAWDNADVGVVVFDEDRHFIAMNRSYCTLTGYRRDELAKLQAGESLAGDDDARQAFAAIVDGRSRQTGHATIRRKDGDLVPVEWIAVPTTVSSMPYFIGVVWRTADAARS